MASFLRCAFILVLLGAAALGDARAKDVAGAGYGVGSAALAEREPRKPVSIQPRILPSCILRDCRKEIGQTIDPPRGGCENGVGAGCPAKPSEQSLPTAPQGSGGASVKKDEKDKEMGQSVQGENQIGNQQGQNNGNSGASQPREQKPTDEIAKDAEKPTAPQSGGSSEVEDRAKEKEKNENPNAQNEGQHDGQGATETSGALFREKTSVILLLAVLSRFCACKC
ncbi:hypothetical protein ERJ75_001200400 [Trypanosoma vivax]|nr:hypothetical protein ERJ75_001200400 [Trypanosoma vivax]